MKLLFLGYSNNAIYPFLKKLGDIYQTDKKITDHSFLSDFDWIISYGYRHLLKKEHISSSKNPILNLHISYLPFNRGADPNYWSWVENTPKGVTIHKIDEGIDSGDIYIQKEITFSSNETLTSSYLKLQQEIEQLFIASFKKIIDGKIRAYPQKGPGTLHFKKDFPGVPSWDIQVADLLKR